LVIATTVLSALAWLRALAVALEERHETHAYNLALIWMSSWLTAAATWAVVIEVFQALEYAQALWVMQWPTRALVPRICFGLAALGIGWPFRR
jgi:hypothetical protein